MQTFIFTPKHFVYYMQTVVYHTKSYCIAYTNIHVAHQIISYSICKHSFSHQGICVVHVNSRLSYQIVLYSICEHTFCTPKHIVWVHANIHFHTKAYLMVHTSIHFHTVAYHVARASIRISHQRVSSQ